VLKQQPKRQVTKRIKGSSDPFFWQKIMKKEIKTFLTKSPQKNYYTYEQDGYKFIIEKLSLGRFSLLTSIKQGKEARKFIDQLYVKYHNDVIRSYYDEFDLGVVFKSRASLTSFKAVIDQLVAYFKENNLHNICSICHEEKEIYFTHNSETMDLNCDTCEGEYEEYPVNHLMGFLAALVFSVFPAIIWAVFHDFGFLVCLDGLLFGYMGYKGFLVGGVNLEKKDGFLILLANIIALCVGQLFAYGLAIQEVYKVNFKASVTLAQAMSTIVDFAGLDLLSVTLQYFVIALIFNIIILIVLFKKYKKSHAHRNKIAKLS
jgi:hypothetical protein